MGRRSRKSSHPAKPRRRAARPTVRKVDADLRDQLNRRSRELDDALQQQLATSEILGIVRQSRADAQPALDAIVQSASRLCGAIFGVVYLYEDGRLRVGATENFTPAANTLLTQRQHLKRPERSHLAGRAILDRKIVHVPDVLEDPEYSRELVLTGGFRAVLSVPLLRDDGAPLGALSAAKAEAEPFSERQIQLLKTFVEQAVIAIENARLLNELRQRTNDLSESLEQQTATSEVLKVISSSPSELKPVFDAILENATRICEAKFGTMWLREGDAFRVVALHNAPPAYEERRRNRLIHLVDFHPKSAFSRFLTTRQVTHISDIRMDQGYLDGAPTTVEVADAAGARTVLMVPMLKDNELVGSITIYRQEVRLFADTQIELVKNFANQAVIAIENTRLLNELRESLQQQTATADVLKVISTSPGELEPVFQTMLENAVQVCEAKFGTLYRCDGKAFYRAAGYGTPAALNEAQNKVGRFLPEAGTLLDRVSQTRKVAQSPDEQAEATLGLSAKYGGARSIIAVPMLKENELIGVIVIYRQEVRPFTDKQIEVVSNFAAQAVIAIENTRLLNELRESLQQQTATADVLKVI